MIFPRPQLNFDYDPGPQKTEMGMVRVKAGEITEVERSVMQALRSEEKRLRLGHISGAG